jgi:hypothetical protein
MNAATLEEIKTQLMEAKTRLEQDLKDMGFHPGSNNPKTPDFPNPAAIPMTTMPRKSPLSPTKSRLVKSWKMN